MRKSKHIFDSAASDLNVVGSITKHEQGKPHKRAAELERSKSADELHTQQLDTQDNLSRQQCQLSIG